MPRLLSLSILLVSIALPGNSQTTTLSLSLQQRLQETPRTKKVTRVFIKGNPNQLKKQIPKHGGTYLYGAGNIAAVKLPLDQLRSLARQSFIKRIEDGRKPVKPLNDKMKLNNFVGLVHRGMPPLSHKFQGDSVTIGFIDTGIEYDHPDLLNDSGQTRIKYIWNQRASGNLLPYGYGKEWDETAINKDKPDHGSLGHGTKVTGIGTGNGRAVDNFTGVAPNADIIFVPSRFGSVITTTGDTVTWLGTIADGVHYIFSKADSMNQPCVINISLGTYQGSHDGKDLASQLIANMIEAKPGRAVVAAAGNAGYTPYHLSYPVIQDTSFTWFRYINSYGKIFFDLWADTADFSDVQFAFGADKITPNFHARGHTPFTDMYTKLGQYSSQTLNNKKGERIGIIRIGREIIDNRFHMQVSIFPDSTNYRWRFMTTGAGSFDLWTHPDPQNASNPNKWQMIHDTSQVPDSNSFAPIISYRYPDTLKSMVSSFQCSPAVITVGNYANRVNYFNINGNIMPTVNDERGEMVRNSSSGPTRDGRIKPNISASGNGTLSCAPLDNLKRKATKTNSKVALGGMHLTAGGTSAASPVVAGAVALLFQKYPQINYQRVQQMLQQTAYEDQYTGATPNPKAGFGKLHTYNLLSTNLHYGCTQPTAYNYDPKADINDSSCIPVIYGCTDTSAINYDSTANTSDGSCKYRSTSSYNKKKNFGGLANYPNPFRQATTLHYKFPPSTKHRQIVIYNNRGKRIHQFSLSSSTGSLHLDE